MTSEQGNATAGKPFKLLEASQALAGVRHLGDLPEAVRSDLVACMQRRAFSPGQVIFLKGEPAEALYILAQGWVKATRLSPEGREQAMLFLRPGEMFGDIAVYTGIPYPGTVVAMEPVVAWAIAAAGMQSPVIYVPTLAHVTDHALANVYVFTNGVKGSSMSGLQPSVFDNPPGTEGYTPLRRLNVVAWSDETNARELKTATDVLEAAEAGELTINQLGVVINMPFVVWDGGKR